MSIGSPANRRLAAPLLHRVGVDANAAQIAEAVGTISNEIDSALAPVIGKRGVAALFKRSLHVTTLHHPWAAAPPSDAQPAPDLAQLKALLAKQSSADAAAGGSTFLETFHDLLATLIGDALTERLLRSVWGPPLSLSRQDNAS